jgi:non-ribosomal peptide synthetase component F
MFASLKADCIFVPVDTANPPESVGRILQKCECRCLLAERSTSGLLHELTRDGWINEFTRVGFIDGGANFENGIRPVFTFDDLESLSDAAVHSHTRLDEATHIFFPSCSSGKPKGIVITHASVMHFIRWALTYFEMSSADRNSGYAPLHSDLSVFDIFGTIAAGAQVHLVTPEISRVPHELAEFMREAALTQWFSAPWALEEMAKFDVIRKNDFPALKRVLWCGAKLPKPALVYWMQRLPHVTFDNLYGSPETTIASSYYRFTRSPEDVSAEAIGSPCKREMLLLLDDELRPVKRGETGGLYIGGVGLSPGYWKDPQATKEAFRPNPYSSNPFDRLYKTGDLAKLGADGVVYLIKRSDSQTDRGGYGIEPGKVEATHTSTGE